VWKLEIGSNESDTAKAREPAEGTQADTGDTHKIWKSEYAEKYTKKWSKSSGGQLSIKIIALLLKRWFFCGFWAS